MPITPYNGTAVQNVSIGLIGCQSICNQSDEISYVVKDMECYDRVTAETLLTVKDQISIGKVTPAGYSFHHAVRIHKKDGRVCILFRDSLGEFLECFNSLVASNGHLLKYIGITKGK